MNGKIVFRIVSALVLIAAIGGIAYFAFNAGVTQGLPVSVGASTATYQQRAKPAVGFMQCWATTLSNAPLFSCFLILAYSEGSHRLRARCLPRVIVLAREAQEALL